MANVTIPAMTDGAPADGTEILVTSKGAAPRRITVADIKTYVVDQIEAITAGTAVDGSDKVFILDATDSELKPVDIDLIAQHAIDTVWAKTAETVVDDADVLALKDGGSTEKTVTAAILAAYVLATIEADILDVSDLADGSSGLAVGDYMLVTQGSTAKQVTVQNVLDLIYVGLGAHVAAATDVGAGASADLLYLVRGSTPYRLSLDDLAAYVNAEAALGGSGTTDFLAQWSGANTLKAGPSVTPATAGFSAGLDTAIPTTAAVRGELDKLISDSADIGADLVGTDTVLVDDGAAGTQRKSALSRLWTYVLAQFSDDMTEGAGITSATGEICEHRVVRVGGLYKTEILVDLTGLNSGGAADDIIGDDGGAASCHIGQITAAINGAIVAGRVTCFETPTGGDPDVDLYSATESTGAQDAAVTGLTETKLINHGDWTFEDVDYLDALPAADEYLYLACGDVTDADYTAGILLIELWGK